ncbi:MAG: MerR family transcriptional regulator, partial [Hyphomicrobiales bacterium]
MDVTIGEAARRSGVHIETIRYYEREKIIPKPIRTDAGRRL